MDEAVIYFAYGSNLDPVQMRARCPGHEVLARAVLRDFRLCFPRRSPVRGCATAGLAEALGGEVWGVLYRLSPDDLTRLHQNEGYDPGAPPGNNRHVPMAVEVLCDAMPEGRVRAFTYRAVPDGTATHPSRDYMAHILRGALHHGLPASYVATLRGVTVEAQP